MLAKMSTIPHPSEWQKIMKYDCPNVGQDDRISGPMHYDVQSGTPFETSKLTVPPLKLKMVY